MAMETWGWKISRSSSLTGLAKEHERIATYERSFGKTLYTVSPWEVETAKRLHEENILSTLCFIIFLNFSILLFNWTGCFSSLRLARSF